ncbi:hypothetical protein G8S49_01710 [Clostridium botulinum C]|uniref:AMP-activated protein kinase glycogen-binding domain-containing protein n=2 Tax=Clostridium botulinum TaxID=1491 RepID=A0A9Q4TJT3_CLOBO|nr:MULTISPECIES: hypothetical protein [Clostridium]EGO87646.1 hypothetical protein CBCST_10536 [Clostridium botulinum C str. Stockholm]MBO3442701.1 hypothetical protein [Clostridium haemolyticum]MCD3194291.1 hypothetical protein [Clostridium botulinum C]MCD3199080.1 hypothetical protein [Clostridium botulinum C]MCD3204555.1 hypothetical protein [Clostridium botulinum C]
MEITFRYEEKDTLVIDSLSVIGKFNNYDSNKGKMIKNNNEWTFTCDLPTGEHPYKFLINNHLKLNDPSANIYLPDENEELWSVIIINDEGNRLYNNIQYTVHIDKYNICSNVNEEETVVNKKSFNSLLDKKIVTRFKFTNITGLHAVTTAWYTPKGELFQITENNLFTSEGNEDKPVTLWFWMDLEDKTRKYPHGIWSMKLFIDGEFVLEDKFELLKGIAYSYQGKIKY